MKIKWVTAKVAKITWAIASLNILLACGESAPTSIEPPTYSNLPTHTIALQNVAQEITFDATLEAVNKATVSAQTSGRVVALPFDVGDIVPKGAVIVQLTDTEQSAAVKAAVSQHNEAKIRFEEAQRNFNRAQSVFEKKLISQAEFDRASTEFNSAKARLNSAEASAKTAEQNLAYTKVTAPYGGIVLERFVQVGETVAPGTPLISGLSLEHLRAIVNVPVNYITDLRKDPSAKIQLPSDAILQAKELRFPPSASNATQSFKVIVELPAGDHGVFPGTLVKAIFNVGKKPQILLADEAIVHRGELTGVYVLGNDGSLNLRYVRLGPKNLNHPNSTPVLTGLTLGEQIVTNPAAAAAALKMRGAP